MATWIYSHNINSEGANLLKDAMGIRKIRHEGSRFRGAATKRVINWGSSTVPEEVSRCQVLNRPAHVRTSSNKLDFFRKVNDELLPPWTTEHRVALEWVTEGDVCARQVLNGHSAAGLIIMTRNNPQGFVQAPLYTKYIKKAEEYRVHVVNGRVIDSQKKVLSRERAEAEGTINWQIRNLANGFIYQRNNIAPPQAVFDIALQAMRDAELHFGAVDIIWNQRTERPYVLEINTAPGITGTTVQNYAEALRG